MNTDDLIQSLSTGVRPVAPHMIERRLFVALAIGGAITALVVVLGLGLRHDLTTAMYGYAIWMKWAYTLSFTLIALFATYHLARPEATRSRWLWLLLIPVGLLSVIAVMEFAAAPQSHWLTMWLGDSWRRCSMRVLILAAPIFAGLIWAFRRFAPTRLRLTGAAAGLASGAFAALLYSFRCDETSAAFVLTWYTLGMGGAAVFGALVGPRLLRW
ncbi:DUF1109 domain-containing protein [Sphingomonas sp.]|jgi:hypothetical protein|uniref:DUF1109 domain-containing protein n=1 Tax=Sphingomonas sp. TaxID=28214 RepID=UPI00356710DA